jgi:hypothetical protein
VDIISTNEKGEAVLNLREIDSLKTPGSKDWTFFVDAHMRSELEKHLKRAKERATEESKCVPKAAVTVAIADGPAATLPTEMSSPSVPIN